MYVHKWPGCGTNEEIHYVCAYIQIHRLLCVGVRISFSTEVVYVLIGLLHVIQLYLYAVLNQEQHIILHELVKDVITLSTIVGMR